MDTFLKDKSINSFIGAISLLTIIVSVFFIIKIVNEIKLNRYIGSESQSQNVIYVSGEGEVNAVSDIASLRVSLSEEGKTAKEAQNLLNESLTKTLDYLESQNIEDKDIKSQYGGLTPKYSYDQVVCMSYPCPRSEPKIIGYTATQSIVVKVREVDNANEVRTGLADLGIKNINGPTFQIDDEDAYKAEARALAIDDAKAKAKVLAKDLGVRLGKIKNFSENGGNNYPVMYSQSVRVMEDMAGGREPAPELPKGENTITSNITITYEIR